MMIILLHADYTQNIIYHAHLYERTQRRHLHSGEFCPLFKNKILLASVFDLQKIAIWTQRIETNKYTQLKLNLTHILQ